MAGPSAAGKSTLARMLLGLLEPHEGEVRLAGVRLADGREVVFWDQLGCGRSTRPSDPALWTMERSVAEMDAVV